jgi:hypothetical protein
MLKSTLSLSRHFEYANKQITSPFKSIEKKWKNASCMAFKTLKHFSCNPHSWISTRKVKKLVKPSFKLSWEPLIFQQNIYRRKIPQQCYRNWPNLSRQLECENSRFPPSFKFWSVSTIQKHWEEVKKCILHVFQDWTKSTFLTIPILVAGTNSVSSGNIVEESFLENCPAQANRKFPVQLYVKIQILFEPPFWICKWENHL